MGSTADSAHSLLLLLSGPNSRPKNQIERIRGPVLDCQYDPHGPVWR